MHRSDDSGTTGNFTDYLAQASDGEWAYEADGVWPIQGGEAAEGTSGVVAAVKAGAGAIGYADESQAGGLGVAAVKVGEEYNKPSAEGAAKVDAISPRVEGRADVDMAIEMDRTYDGVRRLPDLAHVVPASPASTTTTPNEAALVKGFLTYIVSDAGQQAAAETSRLGAARVRTGRGGRRHHRQDRGEVRQQGSSDRRP